MRFWPRKKKKEKDNHTLVIEGLGRIFRLAKEGRYDEARQMNSALKSKIETSPDEL